MEIQNEDAMELEKVKEGRVPSLEKTKFGRKSIDNMESMSNVKEVMDPKALICGNDKAYKAFVHKSPSQWQTGIQGTDR